MNVISLDNIKNAKSTSAKVLLRTRFNFESLWITMIYLTIAAANSLSKTTAHLHLQPFPQFGLIAFIRIEAFAPDFNIRIVVFYFLNLSFVEQINQISVEMYYLIYDINCAENGVEHMFFHFIMTQQLARLCLHIRQQQLLYEMLKVEEMFCIFFVLCFSFFG